MTPAPGPEGHAVSQQPLHPESLVLQKSQQEILALDGMSDSSRRWQWRGRGEGEAKDSDEKKEVCER